MRWCFWDSPAAWHLCLEWRGAPGSSPPSVPLAASLPAPGGASTAPGLSAPSPGCPATTFSLFSAHKLFLLTAPCDLAEDPQSC